MSAFDHGQSGVWHYAIFAFKPWDGNASDGYKRLGIRHVFCDPEEVNPEQPTVTVGGKTQPNYMFTPDAASKIRNAGLVPQIGSLMGTHTSDGKAIAASVDRAIKAGLGGVANVNVERGSDDDLIRTCATFIDAFRSAHPTFIYALNVVGRKAGVLGLPIPQGEGLGPSVLDKMRNDPYAHIRVQQTLGNMQGEVELEEERYQYVTLRGFPQARFSFTYAVTNWRDELILPGFFNGNVQAPLQRGDVWSANLLRHKGLV